MKKTSIYFMFPSITKLMKIGILLQGKFAIRECKGYYVSIRLRKLEKFAKYNK